METGVTPSTVLSFTQTVDNFVTYHAQQVVTHPLHYLGIVFALVVAWYFAMFLDGVIYWVFARQNDADQNEGRVKMVHGFVVALMLFGLWEALRVIFTWLGGLS